ncbi:MAG: hypothetical protein ACFE78_09735 [Candidatus Hodarchaeota archaeon]
MLKEFFSLYLRGKAEKILSNGFLILIIILGLLFLDIIPPLEWYIYVLFSGMVLIISCLLILRRIKRTCIALDTKLKRQNFLDETGLEPLKKNKLTKAYKRWLIRDASNKKLDIQIKPKTSSSGIPYYFYCCYCIIPIILLFGLISIIYTPEIVQRIILPGIFLGLFIMYFLIQKRIYYSMYKEMDSEIKRVIFEEETGYKPVVKGRFTFKYKAWLIQNEKKDETSDIIP